MVRNLMFVFFLLCLTLTDASAENIAINPKAPAYHNARFGFSLAWTPGKYTVFEADNGDGITVTDGKGFTMQAYADLEPRTGDVTRKDFFARADRTPKAGYKRINQQQGWYAISYIENGMIIYTKKFYHKDHWPTLHFEYPQTMKTEYDQLVKEAVSNFRPF